MFNIYLHSQNKALGVPELPINFWAGFLSAL